MIDFGLTWMRTRKYEQLAMPGLIVIAVAMLTVVTVIPQGLALWQDWQQSQDLRRELGVITDKLATLKNLDGAGQAVRFGKMTAAIPSNEDLGYFVLGIRSASQQAGVSLNLVDLDTGGAAIKTQALGNGAVEVRMRAVVSGQLNQIQAFLDGVHKSLPLGWISELALSQEVSALSGRVTVTFAYLPFPDSLGEASAPLPVVTAADEKTYDEVAALNAPEITGGANAPVGNENLMY